jgi:galactonate dehydratase
VLRIKITGIEAVTLKVDRNVQKFTGTAGTPGTFAQPADGAASDYGFTKEYTSLYSRKVESLLVKITTDTGLSGWGEAQVPIGPEAPQALVKQVLAPMLTGRDPLEIEVLWHQMYNSLRGRGHRSSFMMDAIAAVDIALWDIAGKYYNRPVHQLLGGAFHNPIPLYHSGLSGHTPEEKAASAREVVRQGYQAIKVYIGKGIRDDIAAMRAVREAVGDGVTLLADALWMYHVHDAIRLGAELEKLDVALLEAPTVMEDVQGHADMARALKLAVAQGETERTRYQFLPYLTARALDVIQPDIGRTGITEGRKILTLAETFNIPAALHMAIGQCVYAAASMQVAAATPNLLWLEMNPVVLEMANRFHRDPFVVKNGRIRPPDRPGLGIEVDEQALKPYMKE